METELKPEYENELVDRNVLDAPKPEPAAGERHDVEANPTESAADSEILPPPAEAPVEPIETTLTSEPIVVDEEKLGAELEAAPADKPLDNVSTTLSRKEKKKKKKGKGKGQEAELESQRDIVTSKEADSAGPVITPVGPSAELPAEPPSDVVEPRQESLVEPPSTVVETSTEPLIEPPSDVVELTPGPEDVVEPPSAGVESTPEPVESVAQILESRLEPIGHKDEAIDPTIVPEAELDTNFRDGPEATPKGLGDQKYPTLDATLVPTALVASEAVAEAEPEPEKTGDEEANIGQTKEKRKKKEGKTVDLEASQEPEQPVAIDTTLESAPTDTVQAGAAPAPDAIPEAVESSFETPNVPEPGHDPEVETEMEALVNLEPASGDVTSKFAARFAEESVPELSQGLQTDATIFLEQSLDVIDQPDAETVREDIIAELEPESEKKEEVEDLTLSKKDKKKKKKKKGKGSAADTPDDRGMLEEAEGSVAPEIVLSEPSILAEVNELVESVPVADTTSAEVVGSLKPADQARISQIVEPIGISEPVPPVDAIQSVEQEEPTESARLAEPDFPSGIADTAEPAFEKASELGHPLQLERDQAQEDDLNTPASKKSKKKKKKSKDSNSTVPEQEGLAHPPEAALVLTPEPIFKTTTGPSIEPSMDSVPDTAELDSQLLLKESQQDVEFDPTSSRSIDLGHEKLSDSLQTAETLMESAPDSLINPEPSTAEPQPEPELEPTIFPQDDVDPYAGLSKKEIKKLKKKAKAEAVQRTEASQPARQMAPDENVSKHLGATSSVNSVPETSTNEAEPVAEAEAVSEPEKTPEDDLIREVESDVTSGPQPEINLAAEIAPEAGLSLDAESSSTIASGNDNQTATKPETGFETSPRSKVELKASPEPEQGEDKQQDPAPSKKQKKNKGNAVALDLTQTSIPIEESTQASELDRGVQVIESVAPTAQEASLVEPTVSEGLMAALEPLAEPEVETTLEPRENIQPEPVRKLNVEPKSDIPSEPDNGLLILPEAEVTAPKTAWEHESQALAEFSIDAEAATPYSRSRDDKVEEELLGPTPSKKDKKKKKKKKSKATEGEPVEPTVPAIEPELTVGPMELSGTSPKSGSAHQSNEAHNEADTVLSQLNPTTEREADTHTELAECSKEAEAEPMFNQLDTATECEVNIHPEPAGPVKEAAAEAILIQPDTAMEHEVHIPSESAGPVKEEEAEAVLNRPETTLGHEADLHPEPAESAKEEEAEVVLNQPDMATERETDFHPEVAMPTKEAEADLELKETAWELEPAPGLTETATKLESTAEPNLALKQEILAERNTPDGKTNKPAAEPFLDVEPTKDHVLFTEPFENTPLLQPAHEPAEAERLESATERLVETTADPTKTEKDGLRGTTMSKKAKKEAKQQAKLAAQAEEHGELTAQFVTSQAPMQPNVEEAVSQIPAQADPPRLEKVPELNDPQRYEQAQLTDKDLNDHQDMKLAVQGADSIASLPIDVPKDAQVHPLHPDTPAHTSLVQPEVVSSDTRVEDLVVKRSNKGKKKEAKKDNADTLLEDEPSRSSAKDLVPHASVVMGDDVPMSETVLSTGEIFAESTRGLSKAPTEPRKAISSVSAPRQETQIGEQYEDPQTPTPKKDKKKKKKGGSVQYTLEPPTEPISEVPPGSAVKPMEVDNFTPSDDAFKGLVKEAPVVEASAVNIPIADVPPVPDIPAQETPVQGAHLEEPVFQHAPLGDSPVQDKAVEADLVKGVTISDLTKDAFVAAPTPGEANNKPGFEAIVKKPKKDKKKAKKLAQSSVSTESSPADERVTERQQEVPALHAIDELRPNHGAEALWGESTFAMALDTANTSQVDTALAPSQEPMATAESGSAAYGDEAEWALPAKKIGNKSRLGDGTATSLPDAEIDLLALVEPAVVVSEPPRFTEPGAGLDISSKQEQTRSIDAGGSQPTEAVRSIEKEDEPWNLPLKRKSKDGKRVSKTAGIDVDTLREDPLLDNKSNFKPPRAPSNAALSEQAPPNPRHIDIAMGGLKESSIQDDNIPAMLVGKQRAPTQILQDQTLQPVAIPQRSYEPEDVDDELRHSPSVKAKKKKERKLGSAQTQQQPTPEVTPDPEMQTIERSMATEEPAITDQAKVLTRTRVVDREELPATLPRGPRGMGDVKSTTDIRHTPDAKKETTSASEVVAAVAVAATGVAVFADKLAGKKQGKGKKIEDGRTEHEDGLFEDSRVKDYRHAEEAVSVEERLPKETRKLSPKLDRNLGESSGLPSELSKGIKLDSEDHALNRNEANTTRESSRTQGKGKEKTKGYESVATGDSLLESRRDRKESTSRQGTQLLDDVAESPVLGRQIAELPRSAPQGLLLRRGSDMEDPVGGLLREDTQTPTSFGDLGSDLGGCRRSPARGLEPVQEVPEAEIEPTKRMLKLLDAKQEAKRDSGYAGDSPHPQRRSLPLSDEQQRDSGVHSGDWSDMTNQDRGKPGRVSPERISVECGNVERATRERAGLQTPEPASERRLRRSPRATPVLREPPAQAATPEPEKKKKQYSGLAAAAVAGIAVSAAASGLAARSSTPSATSPANAAASTPSRSVSDNPPLSRQSSPRPEAFARRSLSNTSLSRRRTPEPLRLRPESPGILRTSGTPTPPLRRVDKRMSGDLRALRDQNNTTPVANEGRVRAKDMADVYDGFGEGRIGSPRSPTRPHSMRRRQSMQVLELENKVEQLLAENRALNDARTVAEASASVSQRAANTLADRDAEIDALKQSLKFLRNEVSRLTEVNDGLASANAELANKDTVRFTDLETRNAAITRELNDARGAQGQFDQTLEQKEAEIADLREQLETAKEKIRDMQRQILETKASDEHFLNLRDEDHFDHRCQQLCSHVQQWVLRFSKFSDMRACRLTSEINDEKTIDRLDNAVLDGSDVDTYLKDRVKRRDIFMSMTMNMIWEFVFTRYLFGMDREQRQKLKSLEKLLTEVGPPEAVRQWRAVTLTLLAKRDSFKRQRDLDTEAVVQAVFQTLCRILPPPSNLEDQIQSQLRRVMKEAVGLSVEMRTQKAEYMMLPPLQPEYDADGELAATVQFNASMMNERSGGASMSNEDLEAQGAVVRVVLFPLVVKKGDDTGKGDEEIVVCPAQVLIARSKLPFGASSDVGAGSYGARSHISVVTEHMGQPEAEYLEGGI